MNYGICYQGSKNKIAERIIATLPPSDHLYDLFAGGCAISHCALLSGKFKHVHISDINDSVRLFENMLEGNIPDGSEWISREEFYRRRDTDPYVRLIWSFANNQRDYIYSRELEPYKKAVHEMIYAPTPNERRLKFKEVRRLMNVIYQSDNQCDTPPHRGTAQIAAHGADCRIFSDLQSSERACRFSNTTNDTTDARRLSQCVPFYAGSMTAKSVITERLKYSLTQ